MAGKAHKELSPEHDPVVFRGGAALAIVRSVQRARAAMAWTRVLRTVATLDIRPRAAGVRLLTWLPPGLPFAMGLSRTIADWAGMGQSMLGADQGIEATNDKSISAPLGVAEPTLRQRTSRDRPAPIWSILQAFTYSTHNHSTITGSPKVGALPLARRRPTGSFALEVALGARVATVTGATNLHGKTRHAASTSWSPLTSLIHPMISSQVMARPVTDSGTFDLHLSTEPESIVAAPQLVDRRANSRTTMPPSVGLAELAGPLCQFVKREVETQVARTTETRPKASIPVPRAQAAHPKDILSDDFIRGLITRMRALAHEERFRNGFIR
jgi:hypothetical protein